MLRDKITIQNFTDRSEFGKVCRQFSSRKKSSLSQKYILFLLAKVFLSRFLQFSGFFLVPLLDGYFDLSAFKFSRLKIGLDIRDLGPFSRRETRLLLETPNIWFLPVFSPQNSKNPSIISENQSVTLD